MTIPVDTIVRKKLILVKQLYQNALLQSSSRHNILNRILSVIGFDLSTETLLRAIVSSLETRKVPPIIVGDFPSFASGIQLIDRFGKTMSTSYSEQAYQALEKMRDTLLHLFLGVNDNNNKKYKQIAGLVVFSGSGDKAYHSNMKKNISPDEAEFIVAYCTDTIYQIESSIENF
jgi:hypothetical protein